MSSRYNHPTFSTLQTQINMLTKNTLFILFSIMFALLLSDKANAQTCRVTSGTSSAGVKTYREVYEYDFVDEKPVFPGGDSKLMCFINHTRQYPQSAYRSGVQGRVTCSFVINIDGSVSNIKVVRGVEQSLNEEAVRILTQMPPWTPGKQNGVCVPVRVIWSVPFRI